MINVLKKDILSLDQSGIIQVYLLSDLVYLHVGIAAPEEA